MNFSNFVLGISVLLLAVQAHAGDIVVVVSAKTAPMALGPEQVAHIFLAQTARFPNGNEVTAIDQPIGSDLRNAFYRKVTGMSPPLVKSYWTKMVFTGRGRPPVVGSSSVAIRKLIADDPMLIGYIDRDTLDDSVREVFSVN